MTRAYDPRRLDVDAVAGEAATLGGAWPLAGFERLADSILPPDSADAVTWRVEGLRRAAHGAASEVWLRLEAHAKVRLECQRCLEAMEVPLDVARGFRFVSSEAIAAELDAEDDEHDVLEMTRTLDLHELVEDELLLVLPIVPRHDMCEAPPVRRPDEPAVDLADDTPHPFAGLAALKRGPTGTS